MTKAESTNQEHLCFYVEDELNDFIEAFSRIPSGTIDMLKQTDKEMKNNMPDFIGKVQTKDFRRKLNRKKWKAQRGRK